MKTRESHVCNHDKMDTAGHRGQKEKSSPDLISPDRASSDPASPRRPRTPPALTPLVRSLSAAIPFISPEEQARENGHNYVVRLGANENAFGPSPKALEAMARQVGEIWKYGDSSSYALKQALAQHHAIDPGHIVIGEGIDALLAYLARLYVNVGTSIINTLGSYPTFNYHVVGYGGVLHEVPYREDAHTDCDALVQKAHDTKARMVYLANPDNPTGTWHRADVIMKMADDLPEECLLVLDEAYADFAPEDTVPPVDCTPGNVLRLRTFSKSYGLAGARIGYAIAHPDVIAGFHKIRNHFGISPIAQSGALAALQDQDYLAEIKENVARARQKITKIAHDNGLRAMTSTTNFVTLDCGRGREFAQSVLGALLAQGVFIRTGSQAPCDAYLRISCGTDEALKYFAKALPRALHAAEAEAEAAEKDRS